MDPKVRARIPADAADVVVQPYRPGGHECCCGNPACTDFEDRMAAMGIPLNELTEVEFTRAAEDANSAIEAHLQQAEPVALLSRSDLDASVAAAGFASAPADSVVVTYERYRPVD